MKSNKSPLPGRQPARDHGGNQIHGGRLGEYALLAACLAPLAILSSLFVFNDPWGDEAGTLIKYTFIPLWRILTWYPEPQNHIFFNAVNAVFAGLAGITGPVAALASPWPFRALSLAYALGAGVLVYLTGKLLKDRQAGYAAAVIYATTVPLIHFAGQIRGYSLSVLLSALAVFAFFRTAFFRRRRDKILLAVSGALLIFTLPTNLYLAAAFFLVSLGMAAWMRATGRSQCGEMSLAGFTAALAASGAGVVIGAACYLPVAADLLRHAKGSSLPSNALAKLPEMTIAFFSGNLVLAGLAGLALIWTAWLSLRGKPALTRQLLLLACLFALPFVLSYLRGERPVDRLFLNLVTVHALFLGLLLQTALEHAVPGPRARAAGIVLLAAICSANAVREIAEYRDISRAANARGEFRHTFRDAFYLFDYNPSEIVDGLARAEVRKDQPVLLDLHAGILIFDYLNAHGYRLDDLSDNADLDFSGQVTVITNFPARFTAGIKQLYPAANCAELTRPGGFYSLFSCTYDGFFNKRLFDLERIRQALESYRRDHGSYPLRGDLTGLIGPGGALLPDWIPGLVPAYLSKLPGDPRGNTDPANQYLYASNGTDFKLIAHHPNDCPEVAGHDPGLIDPLRGCGAYGFWTPGAASW